MEDKEKQINRTDNFGELSDTVSIPNKEKTISVSKFEDIKLTIPCKKEIEEKQIEEMAKDIGISFQLAGTTRFGAVAEELISLGWIKPDKDSVVLSKEKYKNLKHYEDEMYRLQGVVDTLTNEGWDILDEKEEKIRKIERKETAEKFINDVLEFLKVCPNIITSSYTTYYEKVPLREYLIELAKQFGVEIKE